MTRAIVRRRLAWALWILTMALLAAGNGLAVAGVLQSSAAPFSAWPAATLNGLAFAGVGLIVAVRRGSNPVGWLFLALGPASGLQLITGEYAMYDRYVLNDRLAGAAFSAWVCNVASILVIGLLYAVLLLFPDGRFMSLRWRRFAAVAALLVTASTLALAIEPGELGLTPGIDNPFAVDFNNPLVTAVGRAPFELAIGAPPLVCAFVGVASLVVRWRRAGQEQRAQVKWVLFAAAAGLSAIVLSAALIPFIGEWLNTLVWDVALAVIPVAAGISILRYRLYDIDRIVSRTASYAVITGLLIAVYAGLVTAASRLTPSSNSLAVAASTLAVAALFQPLRRRVQVTVDQRFNRSRYDAARTVDTFSHGLREQVDLEALTTDLLAVVRRTVQPATVSLWLRGGGGAAP